MDFELTILFWSIILGIVHIMLASQASLSQRGMKWNWSSREGNPPPLKGMAGRVSRASDNFKETFPFFVASVLLVHVLGKESATSNNGALFYFCARVLYLPIYAFDVTYVRTAVWGISMAGIFMILLSAWK